MLVVCTVFVLPSDASSSSSLCVFQTSTSSPPPPRRPGRANRAVPPPPVPQSPAVNEEVYEPADEVPVAFHSRQPTIN